MKRSLTPTNIVFAFSIFFMIILFVKPVIAETESWTVGLMKSSMDTFNDHLTETTGLHQISYQSELPADDPRLLETANISGISENLSGTEQDDPRLLETANISGISENLSGTEQDDPRLLETP
jgi:hypothetical protein